MGVITWVISAAWLICECLQVGGSSGTIFAWDLRWPQQPIPLSGVGLNGTAEPVCESEVWEVLFDTYTQSSDIISSASARILPVMMCSEDGILAVVEQGKWDVHVAFGLSVFSVHPSLLNVPFSISRWETPWIACWSLCYQLLWHRSSEPLCKSLTSPGQVNSFCYFLRGNSFCYL